MPMCAKQALSVALLTSFVKRPRYVGRRSRAASPWPCGTCDRVADDWLVSFWEAAGSNHEIGRSQGLHATCNGIVRQIRSNHGAVMRGQASDILHDSQIDVMIRLERALKPYVRRSRRKSSFIRMAKDELIVPENAPGGPWAVASHSQ